MAALSNPPGPFVRMVALSNKEPGAMLPLRPRPKPKVYKPRLTNSQQDEPIARYQSGERPFELPKAYSISRKTVAGILERTNVKRPRVMTDAERALALGGGLA